MEQSTLSDSITVPATQVETRDPEQEARVAALLSVPRDPAPPFSVAAEVSLAHMVVDYFGNEDIDPALNCDIALRDRARAILAAAAAPDPIFAAIEKAHALHAVERAAWAICGELPDDAPEWKPQDAAYRAWFDHIDNVLMATIPTTAVGCVALARFTVDFCAAEEIPLSQDREAGDTDNIVPLRLIAQSPALAGPAARGAADSDPVFAAIEAHAAARDAFSDTVNASDRAWVAQHGGDLSVAAMASAERARDDASDAEDVAWEALLAIRPTTASGVLSLTRHVARWAPETEGLSGGNALEPAFAAIIAAIESVLPHAAQPADTEAQAISDAIEKLWPEWSALAERDYGDYSPEAEQRCDAMFERRMALIEAAEGLTGSSHAVRYAKALAFAWYEHVGLWIHRQPLSEYGLEGRLVLDIEASLTGAPAWTGAEEPVRGRPAENPAVKVSAQADTTGVKPDADPIKFDGGRPDLSKLTIRQLSNLYDRHVQSADFWNDALHAPWANDPAGAGMRGPNAAGRLVEAEQLRASLLRDAVAEEISSRDWPADRFEQDILLRARVIHELLCNGDLRETPALLTGLVEQWGASA